MFSVALHGGAGVIPHDIDGTPFRVALTEIITSVHAYATSLIRKGAPMYVRRHVLLMERHTGSACPLCLSARLFRLYVCTPEQQCVSVAVPLTLWFTA
jgi:hypothetical protein